MAAHVVESLQSEPGNSGHITASDASNDGGISGDVRGLLLVRIMQELTLIDAHESTPAGLLECINRGSMVIIEERYVYIVAFAIRSKNEANARITVSFARDTFEADRVFLLFSGTMIYFEKFTFHGPNTYSRWMVVRKVNATLRTTD